MTEDKMFIAMFNYIEHLFGKIKPKKLFFMAVDGVAPRAKMNQQRSRRFRTAMENENAIKKAIAAGEEMPTEEPFDSNSITPGTAFMARISNQLKYFINKKISEDVEWRGVEVILSGHEVPGEGEHKIKDYIRMAKAQPGYDHNIRHCLYGLDADLIMLGLLSHDPHFCLLRDEVTFGPVKKKTQELQQKNFFLMHLSLLREYLDLEFQDIRGTIDFDYDLERIVDDFILMAFFVGNDFLPNVPNLHINEGALSLMYQVYKKVLPHMDGYMNEYGVINLKRLELFLGELENFEFRFFEAEHGDADWMRGQTKGHLAALDRQDGSTRLSVTPRQRDLFDKVKKFVAARKTKPFRVLDLPGDLPEEDAQFVTDLAKSLHLLCLSINDKYTGAHNMRIEFPKDDDGSPMPLDDDSVDIVRKITNRWERAPVIDATPEQAKVALEKKYRDEFEKWKDQYYYEKVEFHYNDTEQLTEMNQNYVEGLQWVLHYYYHGCPSWEWFYHYHFSPRVSDIRLGLSANLNFKLGSPFKPFEQLMGVLPERSKKLIPDAFKPLMTEPTSPIFDFYPHQFELDMNGKKQDWEAVVKIPFINETRLLEAMRQREGLLTNEEKARNSYGHTFKFSYTPSVDTVYKSSYPEFFPDIVHCHCAMNIFDNPSIDGLDLVYGLCEGVSLGVNALAGFPSLKTLPYTANLGFHGVQLFQMESKNESMVISLVSPDQSPKAEAIAFQKVDKVVYVGWPFLHEAKVNAVSDELFRYELKTINGRPQIISVPHSPVYMQDWRRRAERIQLNYSKRVGVLLGPISMLVHVEPLKGLNRADDGARKKYYGSIKGFDEEYALQSVVDEVVSQDSRYEESGPVDLEEDFPIGSKAFYLGELSYGQPLQVVSHTPPRLIIRLLVNKDKEPEFGLDLARYVAEHEQYFPSFAVAKMVKLHPLVLSKILSSFSVNIDGQRVNLGLNLKFEAKKQKVLGYSRRSAAGWEFSSMAVQLVIEYRSRFPEFFTTIEAKKNADMYNDSDFYKGETAKAKFSEIKEWLKSVSSKNFERVSLDDQQFGADAVARLESMCDAVVAKESQTTPSLVKGVPRGALLKPFDCEHRLQNQAFALGERVIYVQDSGKVPMGLRGTVVGVSESTAVGVDIVFDATFLAGTTLGGRCSEHRGMTVAITTVLNLTTPQVIASSKASEAMRLRGAASSFVSHPNAWRMPARAVGSESSATASGPRKVNGSVQRTGEHGFTVVSGQRGRGRHDGGSAGYGVAIPPPEELTTASRGRGRARGRVRGRGRGESNPLHRGRGSLAVVGTNGM